MSLLFWLWLGVYLVVGVVLALRNYWVGRRTEVALGLMSREELIRVVWALVLLWLPLVIGFLWEVEVLPWIRRRR